MTKDQLAQYFDHTLLKQVVTDEQIHILCEEAIYNNFYAVCVNPYWISKCRLLLEDTNVKVCTVVGFPLGANDSKSKIHEAQNAIQVGAQEIDFVINVGALKSGHKKWMQQEIKSIVETCGDTLTKVIVESGELTEDELLFAIEAVNNSDAKYIKTSTGFASAGATERALVLMREHGREDLKIKASGGIKTLEDAMKYIQLGVSRIGASQSVRILEELEKSSH